VGDGTSHSPFKVRCQSDNGLKSEEGQLIAGKRGGYR
jgi:hypothetical protein